MSASEPFTRIHWYVYVGLVSPLASTMPVVTAVSVWPTCAVPVMVGAPVAAVLGVPPTVPLTLIRTALLSIVSSKKSPVKLPIEPDRYLRTSAILHPVAPPLSSASDFVGMGTILTEPVFSSTRK